MMNRKKQEVRFHQAPTIEIIEEESSSSSSPSPLPIKKSIVIEERTSTATRQIPKLTPYTPPDTLMFPLFSAIQHKAWTRAKKLSYELLLCDPERRNYIDLYIRLEYMTNLIEQRRHPRSTVSSIETSANSDGKTSSRTQSP